MSRLSKKDADAFRSWFEITAAVHADEGVAVPTPGRPLGLMLIVYLSLQPEEAATYTALRIACRLKHKSSLTEAVKPLQEANLVASTGSRGSDGRERALRLTDQGRNAVGQILKARQVASN